MNFFTCCVEAGPAAPLIQAKEWRTFSFGIHGECRSIWKPRSPCSNRIGAPSPHSMRVAQAGLEPVPARRQRAGDDSARSRRTCRAWRRGRASSSSRAPARCGTSRMRSQLTRCCQSRPAMPKFAVPMNVLPHGAPRSRPRPVLLAGILARMAAHSRNNIFCAMALVFLIAGVLWPISRCGKSAPSSPSARKARSPARRSARTPPNPASPSTWPRSSARSG